MLKSIIYLIVVSIIAIISCSDKPRSIPEDPKGEFVLYLQDDLADYTSVNVSIDLIAISRPGQSNSWSYLFTTPQTYDLTSLRNGNRAVLIQNEMTAGYIDSIKIIFNPEQITVDGTTYSLGLLPGAENEFKDFVMIHINEEQTTTYLLDIDLKTSITYNAQSGVYYFEPNITLSNIDSTGGIHGTVTPLADVYLLQDIDTTVITYTKSEPASNVFGFYGIQPGFYNVLCRPRGAYSITHDSLLNQHQPVIAGTDFNMGDLELPPK